jgi:hypothetical protein
MRAEVIRKSLPLLAALLLLVACHAADAQTRRPRERARAGEAELRGMVAAQPDHTAVLHFVLDEGFGGAGGTSKVARRGRLTREENDTYVFIREPGRPTLRLDPKRKVVEELPPDERAPEEEKARPVTPEAMAASDAVTFRSLGADRVGRYACRKMEVRYKDARLKDMRHVLCVAPALKNLIVLKQTLMPGVKLTSTLTDVSLDVPEGLFDVPADYKKAGGGQ